MAVRSTSRWSIGLGARPIAKRLRLPLLVLAAAVILAVPVALAAAPHGAQPGQKIDLKVLLISADGTESTYEAWKAQLDREGVPYDTFVAYNSAGAKARTLTDSVLADYGDNHAKYQAVILSTGDMVRQVTNTDGTFSYPSALTDPEWASLAKLERTFGIRQMSDFTAPTPAHGLNTVNGLKQDGFVGTLTPTGKAAFPYLKGNVPIADDSPTADDSFGYQATPVNAANWQTLLAGPNNTAYLGIYTHPEDGREEMVYTVASNQFQSHNQLLRHGMLNWVTRGVFLGYQRNYLEMDIDDIFLGNDKWNAATNVTDYEFANAIRMTPADVTNALAWQNTTGLKMNMVYNMGGVDLYGGPGGDPLLAAFGASKNQFHWINHTLEHPNLDCTTANYTSNQLTQNQTLFNSLLGPVSPGLNDPSEAVTGEHSGLANVHPGNPGTIDPPFFNELAPTTSTTPPGTLAAGTYDYAITASAAPPSGETVASITPNVTVAAPNNAVRADFNAVCHAVALNLYRKLSTATNWVKVGTLARGARDAVDDGTAPLDLSITDTGAAGTAATLPTSNGAALAPYTQNPTYVPALTAAGIQTVASDSSKPYPNPPTKQVGLSATDPMNFPKGAPFPLSPTIQAVPRYPSNVYYNVANRGDQLDEYNWIYVSPPLGNCVEIPNVTTCRTTAATWAEYVNSENTIMFRHLMDNDPRPHFFHQSNLIGYDPAATDPAQGGGILYGVVGPLLQRYEAYFDRTSEPLVQLSQTQIGQTLTQQSTWAANRTSGKVAAWLQDGRIHVKNSATAPIDVPLTGTTVGGLYGGQKSGWTSIGAGAEQVFAPNDPANTAAPTVSGTAKFDSTLTAGKGTWTGTPTIGYDYQWRRCNAQGTGCSNIAGATGSTYKLIAPDVRNTLRVVVSAGNWISSVSQATSSATGVAPVPPAGTPGYQPGASGRPSGSSGTAGARARSASLALTKLRMSPRRFAVSHRRKQKGTRLDGSRITWKLNKAAKVRLTFQRLAGPKNHRRWVTVGKLSRSAKAGTGVVRFTGRFGKRLLAPRSYRLVVTATKGREKSRTKRMTFKVKRG